MAYRFELNETLEAGFRRIGLSQIERAAAELKATERATAVHDTRKAMKRIRALLRLVRPALGEHVFRRENERFRGIAELLSGTRDAQVMHETLAKLDAQAKAAERKQIARIRAALAEHLGDSHAAGAEQTGEALARLDEGGEAIREVALRGSGFDAAWSGMERVYAKGRKAMARASKDPADETLHEWRKAVQLHWRHMSLLERSWPDALEARASLARQISQLLGDDHDLAVLSERVQSLGTGRAGAAVARLAREEQARLRERAHLLGERLYAARPSEMHERIALYWRTALALAPLKSFDPGEPAPADPAPKKKKAPRPKAS